MLEGIVKFFDSAKQFGFIVTEDGQEFYIGAGPLTRGADFEGTRVRFDRAKTKSPDTSWTRMLNNGRLRDLDGVDARNPRPPRRPRTKPVATNVVAIDPDPGGRS